jgi:hypothetical protein
VSQRQPNGRFWCCGRTLRQLDLSENDLGHAGDAAVEESLEHLFLGREQNVNVYFPDVLLGGLMLFPQKLPFLYALSEMGFRSFIMTDAPPALWPHALGKVSRYPSLVFHLLLQIPGSSNFGVTGKN